MIRSAPFYWLTCDLCGVSNGDQAEYAAWGQIADAAEHAEDCYDWHVEGGNHLCDMCQDAFPRQGDDEEVTR